MRFTLYKEDPGKGLDVAMVRARAGAAYLDRRFGTGWDRGIDLNRLDISSPINCVLGHMLRKWHLSLLFVDFELGVRCGFSCGPVDLISWMHIPAVDRSFKRLTEAWRTILMERQQTDHGCVKKLQQTCNVQRSTPDATQAV